VQGSTRANEFGVHLEKLANPFLPFSTFLEPYIKAISAKEHEVKEVASMATMKRIKGNL
jgi:hypothetical protein